MAQFKPKSANTPSAPADVVAAVPAQPPVKSAARKATLKAGAKAIAAPPVALPEAVALPEPAALKDAIPAPIAPEAAPAAAIESEPVVAETFAATAEPIQDAAPIIEAAPVTEPAQATNNPVFNSKEITMATAFNETTTPAAVTGEMQARFQQAFDKSSTMVSEMTDLAKGNVEAMVESTKLFAAGLQDMGKSYVDEAKSAYETATADMKEMASIKSPTELFQLQGKIMRRNFDALVAATSKSTDAVLKLTSEAMAPISGRVNLTAETMSKVAA